MNEFIVKKSSWHYKWLARYFSALNYIKESSFKSYSDYYKDPYMYDDGKEPDPVEYYELFCRWRPYNFCMYWRHVFLWPALRILSSIVFYVAIAFWLVIVTPYVFTVDAAWGALVVVGFLSTVGILVALVFSGIDLVKRTLTKIDEKAEDSSSLIGAAYKSYKDKFCPGLTYKKD